MDHALVKLGKKPVRHDSRTLKLLRYVLLMPPLPKSTNWRSKVSKWGIKLNNSLGCCAIAGPAHETMSWTANNGNLYDPPDADVLKAYSDVSGYDPRTGQNDNGCNMLDVLNYWRAKGISGHKIAAYASIALRNHDLLKAVLYLLDGCVIGMGLPEAWRTQPDTADWQAPTNDADIRGKWAPGSWGMTGEYAGHCVSIEDFDDDWLYIVSWGKVYRMSWRAYDVYVDESYALFSQDWFNPQFKAPNGFDWTAIAQDLTFMTIPPSPQPPAPNPPSPPTPIPPNPPSPPSPSGDFMQQIIALLMQFIGTLDQKTIINFLVTFLQQIPNPPFYLQILIRLLQGMVNATPAQMQAMEAHAKSVGLVP